MRPTPAQQRALEDAPFTMNSDHPIATVQACMRRGWLVREDDDAGIATYRLTDSGRLAAMTPGERAKATIEAQRGAARGAAVSWTDDQVLGCEKNARALRAYDSGASRAEAARIGGISHQHVSQLLSRRDTLRRAGVVE